MKQGELYKVVNKDEYGTYLATNSEAKVVLEMKPDGLLKSFDKNEVEEVLPYTVSCKFNLDGSYEGKTYNYLAAKGSVEVGDVVLTPTGFATVCKLNTKSKSATKHLKGKLSMEKFPLDNTDESVV